jgi:hypothetical protein
VYKNTVKSGEDRSLEEAEDDLSNAYDDQETSHLQHKEDTTITILKLPPGYPEIQTVLATITTTTATRVLGVHTTASKCICYIFI